MKFLDCIELNPKISFEKGEVYPFIEMANVSTCSREPIYVDEQVYNSGVKFENGDSVVARITPCLQNGKRFYCKNIDRSFGSTEFLVFRPKKNLTENRYLYYLLQTDYIKENMIKSMVGSTGRQRVNNEVFKKLEVSLPPIETQKKIADILSAYDDLIENNQKQIKLLEEAAQRLYKEWFVDLHFPGHESTPIIDGIPQGWKKENFGSIAPILTGKKDANFGTEDGKYPFFTCSQEPIKAPSYSFDTSAVILAGNGDFNVKLYRGKFEAYQRTYVLSPNEEQYLYLLYYAVTDNMAKFIKGASGSTIKFLTKGMIENVSLFIPNRDILIQFNTFMESIQCKIECLKLSIINATEARDRLLPKLMNGEIEVGMDEKETAKKDNFDYIRKHWRDTPYNKDLPLAARSTGDISEETLEKLKEIAEEE